MNPLETLYRAGVTAKNALYDSGRITPRRLQSPVVSIGNLSVGGAGKTPFTIMLAQMLLSHGLSVDVLSRGYGRQTRDVLTVFPQGTAAEFGDEPLLISRKLDLPVVVAASRFAAGKLAERDFQPPAGRQRIHLLDDGFQHRRLHRDFDIVLVTASDLHDRLLPAGRMREPVASLARADAIVLTEPLNDPAALDAPPFTGKQIWRVSRSLQLPPMAGPAVAFAGVAQPQRFFAELKRAGVEVVAELPYRDHHRYTAADIEHLRRARTNFGAACLVTTEKDALNLGPGLRELNAIAVPMRMELVNAEEALRTLLGTLAARRGCPA